jgi:hypothetical protein
MLMSDGSFWLTLLLIVTTISGKDVYMCGLERNFNYKAHHIIQEVTTRVLQKAGCVSFSVLIFVNIAT